MSELKKKNWFRRHWILTILGTLVLLMVLGSLGSDDSSSNMSEENLITISSASLLPQDAEIDREWRITAINGSVRSDALGFVEGAERKITKIESFEAVDITVRAYKFDSVASAGSFYDGMKQKLDVRGVKEWSLPTNCFGIDKEHTIGGSAEGVCQRGNIVFYVVSNSNSLWYASDTKDFLNLMLEKV